MSSDSESTDSDQSVPVNFRQRYRRWLRKRLLSAGSSDGDGEARLRRTRKRSRHVAFPEPRGFMVRRPVSEPGVVLPSPASLLAPAIPAAIVPTQPGRLYAPWPAGMLQRAEPSEWLRLVQASCRPPVVRPTTFLPPREVAAPVVGQRQGMGGAHQECGSKVDLELRLGF